MPKRVGFDARRDGTVALLPADFDMPEYLCSPSEVAAYN